MADRNSPGRFVVPGQLPQPRTTTLCPELRRVTADTLSDTRVPTAQEAPQGPARLHLLSFSPIYR